MAQDRVAPASTAFAPGPRARLVVALAFFAYVLAIRAHDVSSAFLLLGEQMRDWNVALGSWRDLPLTGAPSTAGGRGFGPAYYWILWTGRHLMAPLTGNLPHGGGLFVALLQSVADVCLLVALSRQLPYWLALATALLAATGPFDIAISSVIWNPPVAAALAKFTMALAIGLGTSPSLWRIAGVTVVAWMAVQAHSSSLFVTAPVLASMVAAPLGARQWRRTVEVARIIVETIAVLQVPFVVAQFRAPAANVAPTLILDSLSDTSAFRPETAFANVSNISFGLLFDVLDSPAWVALAAVAAMVAAWRWRREPGVVAICLGPLLTATALFVTWQRPYEGYWFLTLAPAVAVSMGFALAVLPWPVVTQGAGLVALAAMLVSQPTRIEQSARFFKYPQYGTLLAGSRDAARRAPVLRDLQVAFAVHETTDITYLYRLCGGRLGPEGHFVAVIQADGTVTYEPAP